MTPEITSISTLHPYDERMGEGYKRTYKTEYLIRGYLRQPGMLTFLRNGRSSLPVLSSGACVSDEVET